MSSLGCSGIPAQVAKWCKTLELKAVAQVAKRDGPRCFLVCYITCILAPHPHFVVFCGDCAWRTWRYWLEVVLHFNIFYQNMLTHFNHFTVVMSPPELTTIEPAMATFSEAVAPGVAQGLPWCAPKSAMPWVEMEIHWAHRLCAVGCRRRNHKLLVAPATCLHLWKARRQGKELYAKHLQNLFVFEQLQSKVLVPSISYIIYLSSQKLAVGRSRIRQNRSFLTHLRCPA